MSSHLSVEPLLPSSKPEKNRKSKDSSSIVPAAVAFMILMALVQVWGTRYEMNEDGISYLELASAYTHHAWAVAISSYWNPLYPVLLAIPLALKPISGAGEFAVAHVANLAIFGASFLSFRFFFTQLLLRENSLFRSRNSFSIPSWVIWLVGYSVFFSCALDLITLTLVTPDLLVSAVVFAAMGLILQMMRIPSHGRQWGIAGLLGVLLGLGYLAKPVMLLFGLAVLATLFVVNRLKKLSQSPVVVASLVFLAIAGPFIGFLSKRSHHLTISENGTLTYLFVVDGQSYGYPHGSGSPPLSTLKHPPRLLFSHPAVYEFAKPVSGSIPIWYDASYWYEGVHVHFCPGGQIRQLLKNARTLSRIVLVRQASLCLALLPLLWTARSGKTLFRDVFAHWLVVAPATTLVVVNVAFNLEPRLVAPFLTVLWVALLVRSRALFRWEEGRLAQSVLVAAASLLLIGLTFQVGADAANAERGISTDSRRSTSEDRAVASGLKRAGVPIGSGVVYVGNSISAFWAHLAEVRIIAEVPAEDQNTFMTADTGVMRSVLATLKGTGAKAVVAPGRPLVADAGWRPIAGTPYYFYPLNP